LEEKVDYALYLDQVKTNSRSFLEEILFSNLHLRLFIEVFDTNKSDFFVDLVLKVIKLNIANRSEQVLKILRKLSDLIGLSHPNYEFLCSLGSLLESQSSFESYATLRPIEKLISDLKLYKSLDRIFISILIERWSILPETVKTAIIKTVQSTGSPPDFSDF
jgi:hypothetical protein